MTASNFFQRSNQVRAQMPLGFWGDVSRTHDYVGVTGVNEAPQAREIQTIAIPAGPANTEAYAVVIDGSSSGYTTDGTATQAELGDGLEAAINANPVARSTMIASYAAGTLTLTSVWPGISHTVTRSGGAGGTALGAPTVTTAADEADAVSFGRVVVNTAGYTDEGTPKVYVPVAADFTAQVVTFTFTTAAGSEYTGSVMINGRVYTWDAVYNTNINTTCDDIATAINTVLPANTVLAASVGGGGGVVTLTAEVAGAEFEATASELSGGGSAAKVYTTGPTPATSLKRAMVGISVRRLDVENATIDGDDPVYRANEGVEYMHRGSMVVQRDTSETWTTGQEVYVSVAAATKGRIYNTAGANLVWIGRDKILIERSESSTTSDGSGVIRANM